MILQNVEIKNPPILVTIAGDRYFRLEKELSIVVTTDTSVAEYKVMPGFVTDFRSGGPVVDLFIKQFGSDLMQAAYICHDVAQTTEALGAPSLPNFAKKYRQYVKSFNGQEVKISAKASKKGTSAATATIEFITSNGEVAAIIEGYECTINAALSNAFKNRNLGV